MSLREGVSLGHHTIASPFGAGAVAQCPDLGQKRPVRAMYSR